MRRFSAILLLLLFGLSLLTPLLGSDSTSNLPACCRRAGLHHCSEMGGSPASGPALRSSHCPSYPAGFTAGTLAEFMGVLVMAAAAILLSAELAACNSFELLVLSSLSDRAHSKRGPPCSFSPAFV